MPHFRVDDALHSHPKAQRAGDEAIGMWSRAGSFCMAYLTDGFVPDWWVRQQPKGIAKAKRLVDAGLWRDGAEREGEKGWQFHDFTGPGRQDSRVQIEAEREKWRKKKAAQRGEPPRDSPMESQGDSPGDTSGDSTQASLRVRRDPTQPNPTEKNSGHQPDETPVSSPTNAARGSRLPDDWEPPADVIAQMRSDHPDVNLRSEHVKFVDYWHGKAGRDARKADWTATWRNWIRRADEQRPRSAPNGHKIPASDAAFAQAQALKSSPSTDRLEIGS